MTKYAVRPAHERADHCTLADIAPGESFVMLGGNFRDLPGNTVDATGHVFTRGMGMSDETTTALRRAWPDALAHTWGYTARTLITFHAWSGDRPVRRVDLTVTHEPAAND